MHKMIKTISGDELIICVDGGASSTKARIWEVNGKLVGEGSAGPSNPIYYPESYLKNIVESVQNALSFNSLERLIGGHLTTTVIGLAGISGNFDYVDFPEFSDHFANWRLFSDKELALTGAHSGEDGAVIIVGTGSCTFGRSRGKLVSWFDGEEIAIGGYTYPVCGRASGMWIGVRLLQALMEYFEGVRSDTHLLRSVDSWVAQKFGPIESVLEQRLDPANLAEMAPLLFQCSSEDELAAEIISDGVASIMQTIVRLQLKGFRKISLVGGLANSWLPKLSNQIAPDKPLGDSLDGARLLAATLRAAGRR